MVHAAQMFGFLRTWQRARNEPDRWVDTVHESRSDMIERFLQIPFVKRAPMVTFRKPIGSVSVSGHKFIGAPVPCGVVITRQKYISALANNVEYLNSRDATIMGSRNG